MKDGTLDLLFQITQVLLRKKEHFESTLNQVLVALAEFGMERGTIALVDPDSNEIRIEVSHGLSEKQRQRGRYQIGEGIMGRVIRRGEPALVPSIGEEPLFLHRTKAREHLDLKQIAFVCVPIITEQQHVVGTLSVDRHASDNLTLDADLRVLTIIATLLGEALIRWRDHRAEVESLQHANQQLAQRKQVHRPTNIIGNSRQMKQIYRLIEQVAWSDTTVLIRGESGTGKELIAQAIHDKSRRSSGPFVSVNCGALPENLVESELFGHVRGAYTGAMNNRRGRFQIAHKGTLFLDEIADLPVPMQVKLLRALQEGEIHRVGDEAPQNVDVRVIAATNANLEERLQQQTFREDLYYRLNIFPIYLAPLRDRKSDITLLADHFVEKYSAANLRPIVRISTPAIELMTAYHWPGNVRELENSIARAALLSEDGTIRAHHLPPTLQTGRSSGTSKSGTLDSIMSSFERELLIEAMKDSGGVLVRAAAALGTTPRILAYRLKKHGLHAELVRARQTRTSDNTPV